MLTSSCVQSAKDNSPWNVATTFSMGLPDLVKPVWKHPYKQTQKCDPYVISNPVN